MSELLTENRALKLRLFWGDFGTVNTAVICLHPARPAPPTPARIRPLIMVPADTDHDPSIDEPGRYFKIFLMTRVACCVLVFLLCLAAASAFSTQHSVMVRKQSAGFRTHPYICPLSMQRRVIPPSRPIKPTSNIPDQNESDKVIS